MHTGLSGRKGRKRRGFVIPHTYFLLFCVVVLCAALTWVIPAGTFDMMKHEATGRNVINPDTFHAVEPSPVSPWGVFKAFQTGMEQSADIIFFIFIIGGAFAVVQGTGALDAGITRLAVKLQNRQNLLLVFVTFAFSALGATMGMSEEIIVFIPMAMALCGKLGLDPMVALAITMVGSRIGFTTGMANPFTVGVAQKLVGLPLYSGLAYRTIWYAVILIMTCIYIARYASRVKADPTKSVLYGLNIEEPSEAEIEEIPLTTPRVLILIEILVCFAVMFYGVFRLGWYLTELSALFLLMGVLAGVIAGSAPNKICRDFVIGTRDMVFAALVVGVARAILVVLQDGKIIHPIIYYSAGLLSGLPRIVAANGMYVFQLLLNFLIPSGSGQASATMPIMAPISDLLGISRQTAVLAFHYGDGFTNLCFPTVGMLMASLGVAKIPFDRYLKWIMPLLVGWFIVGAISISVATIIHLGPL